MTTINLQCNSPSQIHSSVYFRLKNLIVRQVEHTWESTDTNLAEIHEEMSELLDKQVNIQKEGLKNFRSSRKLPQPTKKRAMKMNETK